jgi:hypothetical protein
MIVTNQGGNIVLRPESAPTSPALDAAIAAATGQQVNKDGGTTDGNKIDGAMAGNKIDGGTTDGNKIDGATAGNKIDGAISAEGSKDSGKQF